MLLEYPAQTCFLGDCERICQVGNGVVSSAAYGDLPLATAVGVCTAFFEFADTDSSIFRRGTGGISCGNEIEKVQLTVRNSL